MRQKPTEEKHSTSALLAPSLLPGSETAQSDRSMTGRSITGTPDWSDMAAAAWAEGEQQGQTPVQKVCAGI